MCRSLSGKLWESQVRAQRLRSAVGGENPWRAGAIWGMLVMRPRLCANLGGIDGVAWWHFREARGWPAECKHRKAWRTYQSSVAIM